jgi:uncharacterized membrane protein
VAIAPVQWLRRSFVTGFFVTVPLIISVVAFIWIFRVIDGFMGPLYATWIGREVPGLGLLTTAVFVLGVGAVANNVIGKRIVQQAEKYLLRVPVFRTVYSPVKQLLGAFSPDNEGGLKRVVIVQDPCGAYLFGFLTKEFTADLGHGAEPFIAVYVPTNNLYLGDVRVFSRDAALFPDISVEDGVRIILTGGMAMAGEIHAYRERARVTAPQE